jgi:hypothetical protein
MEPSNGGILIDEVVAQHFGALDDALQELERSADLLLDTLNDIRERPDAVSPRLRDPDLSRARQDFNDAPRSIDGLKTALRSVQAHLDAVSSIGELSVKELPVRSAQGRSTVAGPHGALQVAIENLQRTFDEADRAAKTIGSKVRSMDSDLRPKPPLLTRLVPGESSVDITWLFESGDPDFENRCLVRYTDGNSYNTHFADVGATETVVDGLTPGVRYTFRLITQHESRFSHVSDEVATTLAPTAGTPGPGGPGTSGPPASPTVTSPTGEALVFVAGASTIIIQGSAEPNLQIELWQLDASGTPSGGSPLVVKQSGLGAYSLTVTSLTPLAGSSTCWLAVLARTPGGLASQPVPIVPIMVLNPVRSSNNPSVADLLLCANSLLADLHSFVPGREALTTWLTAYLGHLIDAEAVLGAAGSPGGPAIPDDGQVRQLTAGWRSAAVTSGTKVGDQTTGDPPQEAGLMILIEGQMVSVYSQLEKATTQGDLIGARS